MYQMKNIIIVAMLALGSHVNGFSKVNTDTHKSHFSNTKVDLSVTFSPPKAIGFIIKGQKEVLNNKHFNGLLRYIFSIQLFIRNGPFF